MRTVPLSSSGTAPPGASRGVCSAAHALCSLVSYSAQPDAQTPAMTKPPHWDACSKLPKPA